MRHTEATKAKIAEARRQHLADPAARAALAERTRQQMSDPAARAQRSAAMRERRASMQAALNRVARRRAALGELDGPRNPAWKGDDVSYAGVHMRLRAERGRATEYRCADCACQAAEWSHDLGAGHSTDLANYSPRCVRCHRQHDRAAA